MKNNNVLFLFAKKKEKKSIYKEILFKNKIHIELL